MPDKKTFSIRLRTRGKNIIIPVMRVVFPNGCVFYKIMQNGSFWLVNVNDRWSLSGGAGKQLSKKIIVMLQRPPGGRSFLRIER